MSRFSSMQIAADKPYKLVLRSPVNGLPFKVKRASVGEGAPPEDAYICILSSDSAVARAYDREQMDRRLKARGRVGAKEIEDETALKFAKLIAGANDWLLGSPYDGSHLDFPCNESVALEVLADLPWVMEQVIEAANDRANFSKA